MKVLIRAVLPVVIAVLCLIMLIMPAFALSPACKIGEVVVEPELQYSDAELNMITNVVNGEVGGICGSVVITYRDGSQLYTNESMLRMIHAKVVDNQVKSDMFPATVSQCVSQYWSPAYAGSDWRTSAQWQSCRESVVNAFAGDIYVPCNVFAATCDPYFGSWCSGYRLWARVDWNTGWVSGTFYYYSYGW